MSARSWWPHELVDEVMPEGKASPSDWLDPVEKGVVRIFGDDPEVPLAQLVPGDTISFVWFEHVPGIFDIAVGQDGEIVSGAERCRKTADMFDPSTPVRDHSSPPADANRYWLTDDHDFSADSLAELARQIADAHRGLNGDDLIRAEIACGTWSEPIQFRLSADGTRLIEVGP